jgi:hypothetical protein
MRAVSVVALVAAMCGYFVSVMARFFTWFLPEEQKRTDKPVYRRTLYGGPVPKWAATAGDVVGTAGAGVLLLLALTGSLDVSI